MPRVMICYLVWNTSELNIFPAKSGISPYYSPRILLNQRTLDYKKECQVPFGAYVQAHNQPTYTNSNALRTLDAIYLRPAQNMQGGHELMDLTSGLVITCANATEIPATDLVIKAVEKMGYGQGFPTTGMKFTSRQGHIYLDNDWIAGVDYDDYEDEENPEDPEDEENPEDENDDNNEETDYEEQQQELAEILHELPEDNPTIDNEEEANEQQEDNEEQEVDNEEQQQSEHEIDEPETETELRISTRTRKQVDRFNLNIHSVLKTKKKVTFMNQDVESKHNLYTQSSPNPHADVEYARDHALLITKAMVDFYHKSTTNTWSFGQQHILQKGLKMFKEKGHA